jgi:hypothetical protein
MCVACKAETQCEHPLSDCSAINGEYCIVCHHNSSLSMPGRKSTPLGPRKAPSRMSAVLREIRQRRGRRA